MDQLHVSPSLTEVITSTEYYSIQREIGRGGTAYCHHAQARHDNDYWVVLKEFAPHDLRPFLQRQTHNGPLVLTESWLQEEYDSQKRYFLDEVTRCKEINDSDGNTESNVPYILRAHYVPERDDLLCIDTEKGWTIYDYVKEHRPKGQLTTEYIAVCLEIISRLMDGLKHIHKTHLHLDITPKNIYIVTTKMPLNAGDTYSVKLFDFASARRKKEFSIENIDTLRAQYPCSTYTQGYTHYSLRDFWTELEYDPSAAKAHVAERPIDERMDLFSVGAVLLYMLTGNSQTVVDGNIDAIQYIGVKDIKNNTLLQLLQELIAGAMMSSDRYMDTAKCDENFSSDLRDIQHGFQNAAGFSAIQVLAICGGKTFADTPQTELMGRLRISNETATNLTSYILAQENGMCLSVTAEQGGAGKTSQMQHLYQTLLRTDLNAIPLLVPLGQLSKGKSPLTQYICQKYCGSNEANEPALIQLLNDHSYRWYLLLDAMDELENGISVDKELRTFVEQCPNLVIVVTSRHNSFHLPENTIEAEILPLERTQASLQFPDASERMLDVLSLPMLFRIAVEVQRAEQNHTAADHMIYGSKGMTVGSYRVDSQGELLEAYMRCQITKQYSENNSNKVAKVLRELLPKAAWKSEQFSKNVILGSEAKKIAKMCGFIHENDLNGEVRFTHERWHRFFKAYYVYQLLVKVADTPIGKPIDRTAWKLLKEECLPEEICSLLGDLTRDYLRVPVQDAKGDWSTLPNNALSPIDLVLEHLRGKKSIGRICANLVNVMKIARHSDLSMALLNNLDLCECGFVGVQLSRSLKHGLAAADFFGSKISIDNLHSFNVGICVDYAIWQDFVIMLCRTDKPIKHIVAVYDINHWVKISTLNLEITDPTAVEIRFSDVCCSLLISDTTAKDALCYAMCTSSGIVRFRVLSTGEICSIQYMDMPTSFSWNNCQYLIPFLESCCGKKQWKFTDKDTGSVYRTDRNLTYLEIFSNQKTTIIELSDKDRAFNISFIKCAGNLYIVMDYDRYVTTYRIIDGRLVSTDSLCVQFLRMNCYIDKLISMNGRIYITLFCMEGSPIDLLSQHMIGIGVTSDEISQAVYSDAHQKLYGTEGYYRVDGGHYFSIHYWSDNQQMYTPLPWRVLCVSPDGHYMIVHSYSENRYTIDLYERSTESRQCIIENATVGAKAVWIGKNCLIKCGDRFYRLFCSNAEDVTCILVLDDMLKRSPQIPFFPQPRICDNQNWLVGGSELLPQPAYHELNFYFDPYRIQYVRDISIYDKDPRNEWIAAIHSPNFRNYSDILSLGEMNTLFEEHEELKPHFLLVEGCNMRNISTTDPDHARFLEILRYNGAIVDDE